MADNENSSSADDQSAETEPTVVDPKLVEEINSSIPKTPADESYPSSADDTTLDDEETYAIFKQNEGVVSWSISNLVDQDGNQYSKGELKANPPVLTLEASDGSTADFVLTKELSGSLGSILDRVYYGYYGLEKKPKKKFTVETAKQSIIDAIGRSPLKVGAFSILAVILIIGLVVR